MHKSQHQLVADPDCHFEDVVGPLVMTDYRLLLFGFTIYP